MRSGVNIGNSDDFTDASQYESVFLRRFGGVESNYRAKQHI